MNIEIMTKSDLEQFKQELLDQVNSMFTVSIKDRWLKSSEVKKLLNISTGTLVQLREEGLLPYSKLGGLYFFKYRDIMDMMELNKHETMIKKE